MAILYGGFSIPELVDKWGQARAASIAQKCAAEGVSVEEELSLVARFTADIEAWDSIYDEIGDELNRNVEVQMSRIIDEIYPPIVDHATTFAILRQMGEAPPIASADANGFEIDRKPIRHGNEYYHDCPYDGDKLMIDEVFELNGKPAPRLVCETCERAWRYTKEYDLEAVLLEEIFRRADAQTAA